MTTAGRAADFSTVTEIPGNLVSRDALAMAAVRYAFAAERSAGKRVLEVACGPGVGLGMLAARARQVVGGDATASLVGQARRHYGARAPVVQLDAQDLPFAPGSFDVVILFEAIYFIPDFERAAASIRRVLAPGGQLVIATVSPARPGFIPAPGSTRYYRAEALAELLGRHGLEAEVFAAFPLHDPGTIGTLLVAARRVAVRLHLMPRTMRGKQLLKRLVFGKLVPFPKELDANTSSTIRPAPLSNPEDADRFIVYYVVATKTSREDK